eukprot:TRINITY_DN33835_c0_g1_i1.p1 TRINITY_DN33835_c0_g1~~TRINITY_DN33835_c0_g1_i1.p1  ORF type:complete len:558 (+),score=50.87 TRINITY_DN33835_c0_g1_i1:90-1763(+)
MSLSRVGCFCSRLAARFQQRTLTSTATLLSRGDQGNGANDQETGESSALQCRDTPTGEKEGLVSATTPTPISFVTLGLLIFYNTSGGPFGSEVAVAAAGPLLAILGYTLVPVFLSAPCALVTAELSTAFPNDSGLVSWVSAAFGPMWGFQAGIFTWTSAAVDNAIYPRLFTSYVRALLCPGDDDICHVMDDSPAWFIPSNRVTFAVMISVVLTYCNWRGLELLGKVSIVLTIAMLTPFAFICILGVPSVNVEKWFSFQPKGQVADTFDWSAFFNVLFWNLSGWESASTVAGEVDNPSINFPKGLSFALLMVVAVYMLPLLVCIGALPSNLVWTQGFYVEAGSRFGGYAVQASVVMAAAVSNVGMFLSEQLMDTFMLAGMAELGLLPAILAVRNRHGVPSVSLVLTLLVVVALSPCRVVDLVEMLNGLNCLGLLMAFAAFLKLRVCAPALSRPYRIPLGTVGCVVMLGIPTALCLLIIIMPYVERDLVNIFFFHGSVLFGFLLYAGLGILRNRSPGIFLRSPSSAEGLISSRVVELSLLPEVDNECQGDGDDGPRQQG